MINDWARSSFPDKALKYFEKMKLAGLKSGFISLKGNSDGGSTYTGILNVCGEIFEHDLTVDMCTTVYWSRLRDRKGTISTSENISPDWNSLKF